MKLQDSLFGSSKTARGSTTSLFDDDDDEARVFRKNCFCLKQFRSQYLVHTSFMFFRPRECSPTLPCIISSQQCIESNVRSSWPSQRRRRHRARQGSAACCCDFECRPCIAITPAAAGPCRSDASTTNTGPTPSFQDLAVSLGIQSTIRLR